MPRFLPVVALALLTASGAAAQICPAGATDLGDGVCLVVEDAQPSGTAPAGLSPADVVPFGIPRVRSADIDFDSTTVPYTVRLQELFATDPDSGRPSIRIAVVAEWTHLPGTPYYSMRAQADGTLFNPTNSSGLPVGAGETHYRARDSFPQDIVAAPGNLVFRNVLVVGVRGEGLDDEEWESLQAQTRARAATFRATWYGALAAFQPALTSEIQIAADSVSAGEPFDLDVVVTNPWGTRALDVKPTGDLAFTDADGQPIGAVDILEEPLPIDTLAGGASGTLRYRVAVRSVGLASATVPIGATWTAYYREPVEARPICSFDGLRTSVASCAVEVSGTNIVVTVDGDDPDADDTDDICDASESEPGLQCTLRAALSVAEKEGGATIRFGIPGGGTPRIAIGGPLAVSVPVLIDGTSQLGKVEIDGSGAGAPFGLTLSGNGSDIRGVAFLRTALAVEGRRSTVAGNRFGSSWASGDTRESVLITSQAIDVSGAGSQIGVAGEPNEFVHVGVGIDIRADSVRVFANLIGDGGRQIGADLHGIVVRADTATIERNEILYTGQTGVLVVNSARRAALLGNVVRFGAGDGVRVEPGAGAIIGGGGIEEENRIEGNGGFGIVTSTASGRRVEDAGTGNLRIISNVTQRNASGGVLVRGVDGVQIGEPSERPGLGLGNTIRDGVRLLAASGTVLQGNLITDERDTPSWPLLVSGDGIQIGGPSAGDGNLIEGSSSVIEATLSTVLVEGQGAVIEGNTIKDGFTGLSLSGASTRVLGNEITLNREYGIVVNGEGSVVGGARSDDACEGPCNLITLNTAGGIQVTQAGVGAQILGNYVGVDNEGAFGNGHGILVSGVDVQIGGPGGVLTGPCDGVCNVIGGNDGYGIVGGELNRAGFVDDSGPRGLVVQGNVIGTGAGSGAPNGIGGVLLGAGTEGAVIGAVVGEADGTRGNLILGNGAVGVRVTSRGGASWNNTIRVNEIVAGNTPIDLVPIGRGGVGDGSTPNDAGDGDEGPNRLLNWPTLVESRLLSSTQAELLVLWTGGNAGTEGTYRLDVYANASCRGWMADASVRVAGATLTFPRVDAALDTVRVRVPYSPALPGYGAILTDAEGNTSEVGNCLAADDMGETQWVTLSANTPEEILGLVTTLRLASGRTASGGPTLGVRRVALVASSDTLFTGDVASIDGGGEYQPGARVGPSWRLSSPDIGAGDRFDVCLPVAGSDPVLVLWRSGATTGLWRPVETVTQAIGGQDYACAADPVPIGDVALAGLGMLATPEAPGPEAPARLTLSAPYPNPSAGALTLHVGVEATGPVRVQLYDVRGRAVARVLDGPLAAGWHDMSVDTRSLAPGVYLVRVDSASNVVTRTVTVVR